jgi:GTPase SAR1 family protein
MAVLNGSGMRRLARSTRKQGASYGSLVDALRGSLGIPDKDREIFNRLIAAAAPVERRGKLINEGFRVVCLGETGSGKTAFMRGIIYHTLDVGYSNFALIHDTKSMAIPEYPRSLQSPDVATFAARWFKPGDVPAVSFRGDPRRDIECSAEDVARYSKMLGQKGRPGPDGNGWYPNPHLLVIEELAAAASAGRKHVSAPSVLWALEQGRKVGVSTLGTTQSPRKIPLDFLGQANAIVFFRLTGADANYLGERLHLDPAMIGAIAGDNYQGLPNHHYTLYMKSEQWDGEIRCLEKRTAVMFE